MSDIERMARKAGMERDGERWFSDSSDPLDAQDVLHEHLERFAALIRAEERERCAQIADTMRIQQPMPDSEESAQDWCASFIASEIRALA